MTTYNTPEITYYLDYEGAFVCPDVGDLDFIGQTNIVHYSQQFKKVLLSQDAVIFLSCINILFHFYSFLK